MIAYVEYVDKTIKEVRINGCYKYKEEIRNIILEVIVAVFCCCTYECVRDCCFDKMILRECKK